MSEDEICEENARTNDLAPAFQQSGTGVRKRTVIQRKEEHLRTCERKDMAQEDRASLVLRDPSAHVASQRVPATAAARNAVSAPCRAASPPRCSDVMGTSSAQAETRSTQAETSSSQEELSTPLESESEYDDDERRDDARDEEKAIHDFYMQKVEEAVVHGEAIVARAAGIDEARDQAERELRACRQQLADREAELDALRAAFEKLRVRDNEERERIMMLVNDIEGSHFQMFM